MSHWEMGAAPFRIDLHRHLEGSHSPAALLRVAETFGLKASLFFDAQRGRYRSVEELRGELTMAGPTDDSLVFYKCIQKARAAYVSEAAIQELARLAFLEAADDTDGFEMRISLFSMTRTLFENERNGQWKDVAPREFAERARKILLGVLAAREEASRATGKTMLVRVGFSRTFESEPHYRAMADVLPEHRAALTGLDLLGIIAGPDKEPLPPPLMAIINGLRGHFPDLTIHAGEFEGAQSVERVLELAPQAIGHGVRSVESDETLGKLERRGVTLEVCPSSNRLLIPTVLSGLEQKCGCHPLVALQQRGVHAVLGSDDPTPMGTSFGREWEVAKSLGVDMTRLSADIERRWGQLPR